MPCMVYTFLIWFLPEYPTEELMRFYIYKFVCKYFSWAGVRPCFKQKSVKISIEFEMLEYFLSLGYMIGQVRLLFFKRARIPDVLQVFD